MKRLAFVLLLAASIAPGTAPAPVPGLAPSNVEGPPQDGKLRIIAFGAHPDDCEIRQGGAAAMWAAQGHHVKFVSVTNGDIGHWKSAGGPLAKRRTDEVKKCAQILGITTEVLDIHDGELMVTMENRQKICRLIREWKADVVIAHRPNDYHPDHRYTGVLVNDAAYMVMVPFFCPDTPPLTKNPVFLFNEDNFQKPNVFSGDIVVGIDAVVEKKLAAMEALESQFYEGGCLGGPHNVPDPANAAAVAARKKEVRDYFAKRFAATANRFRDKLPAGVKHAEAFEICEYGRQPDAEEIKRLFPF